MTLHWADLVWMVAVLVAGCTASYVLATRRAQTAIAASQREMERRLQALTEAVMMQEPGLAVAVPPTDALNTDEMEGEPAPAFQGRPLPQMEARTDGDASGSEEVAPEIQAAIAAATVAIFGNHARVRAARRVPSQDVVSPWTQQGRVIVQGSHNLRTRGR